MLQDTARRKEEEEGEEGEKSATNDRITQYRTQENCKQN